MSDLEGVDYDPHEYARQLGYLDELTKNDFTEPGAVRATTDRSGISRRELLKRGGVGAATVAGLGAMAGPAAAKGTASDAFSGTLRVISLGVEWPQGAQQQAEKDLGFRFNIQLMGTNAQVQKAITDPDSFDVGGLYNYQFFQIWPTGNMVSVDTRKIKAWNQFYPVFTKGRVVPGNKQATIGQGNAPFKVMFVD